jgi:hypothetical protein
MPTSRPSHRRDGCAAQKSFEIKPAADDSGRVNGIVIDPRSKFRLGGADPGEYAYAVEW